MLLYFGFTALQLQSEILRKVRHQPWIIFFWIEPWSLPHQSVSRKDVPLLQVMTSSWSNVASFSYEHIPRGVRSHRLYYALAMQHKRMYTTANSIRYNSYRPFKQPVISEVGARQVLKADHIQYLASETQQTKSKRSWVTNSFLFCSSSKIVLVILTAWVRTECRLI